MPLVFAGVCSHAPGITGRAERADPELREDFYAAMRRLGGEIRAARPDALVIVAAEHFANFFMNNMPAYCMGMAERYEGPIEDPEWLGIAPRTYPGASALSRRLIECIMARIDLAYAEEWQFDHGIMVPLHFLLPEADLPVIPVNINCQGPAAHFRCQGPTNSAGRCARPAMLCRSASPWWAPAASPIGRPRRTPARSTRLGTGTS